MTDTGDPAAAGARIAVVTGGGSGIGFATAVRMRQGGYFVCAVDVDQNGLDRLSESTGRTAELLALRADVSDPDSVNDLRAAVTRHFGRPADVLVTSAGIRGPSRPSWQLSYQEWRHVHAVDLDGVFLCCGAFVPGMLESGWGRVINVASNYGKEGFPTQSAYASAKAAVIAFGRSLGRETAARGVLVHTVTPGAITTPMTAAIDARELQSMVDLIPLGRAGRPEEVAELIWVLSGDQITFSTGSTWDISGGKAVC